MLPPSTPHPATPNSPFQVPVVPPALPCHLNPCTLISPQPHHPHCCSNTASTIIILMVMKTWLMTNQASSQSIKICFFFWFFFWFHSFLTSVAEPIFSSPATAP